MPRRRRRKELDPAPEDLRTVHLLMNTVKGETEGDALADPEAAADWLARRRLLPRGVELSAGDLGRLRALRDGWRALMWAHSGGELAAPAVEELDRASAQSTLQVRFAPDGTAALEPGDAGGFDAVCADLVSAVLRAQIDGRWPRFKICARPGCGRAFYDASKSRTGKWCTHTCGDRVNAALTRRRHPGRPGGSKFAVIRNYARREPF